MPTDDVEMDGIAEEVEESTDGSETQEEETETEDSTTDEGDVSGEETEETEDEVKDEDTESEDDESKEKAEDKTETEQKLEKPIFSQIKKEYPDLFKKHPELRHSFFREQEFSKLFNTVDEAKEAAQSAQSFEFINEELLEGRTENILTTISQHNPASFGKIVNNFLPTLYKLNPDTFLSVTEPVIEHALRSMFKEGTSRGDRNLTLAAQHARNFLFGSHEFKQDEPAKPDPEKIQLQQERDLLRNNQYRSFESEVGNSANAAVKDAILRGLDPEKKLSDFTRDKVVEATMSQLGAALENNPEHMALMSRLWKSARKAGFTPDHRARIVQAYFSRAKDLIPEIRTKVKAAAMGVKTETKKTTIKRIAGGGSPSGIGKTKIDPKKIDWSHTSDLDVLNGTTKFKK